MGRRQRMSGDGLATTDEGAESMPASSEDTVEDMKRKKPHLLFILQSLPANRSVKEHDVVLKEVSELGFFRQFSNDRQRALSRILELQYARAGDVMVQANVAASHVFVILHGVLEVESLEDGEGHGTRRQMHWSGSFDTLASGKANALDANLQLYAGDAASSSILAPDMLKAKSIRSVGDSILLKIDLAILQDTVRDWTGYILADTVWCPVATGNAFESTDRSSQQAALIRRVLSSHAFFDQFESGTLNSLAACVRLRRLVKSEKLAAGPEPDDALYFVSDGEMSSTAGHRFIAGDAFHNYENIEFTAADSCTLLEISDRSYRSIVEPVMRRRRLVLDMGSCRRAVAKAPGERSDRDVTLILELLDSVQSPMLSGLPLQKRKIICQHLKVETHDKDFLVCKQGDPGDTYYVILSGAAAVHICKDPKALESSSGVWDYGQNVGTMHRGEGFGERSLLSKEPRSATIITIARTELIVISKAQYDLIIDDGVELSPALSISILQQDPDKRDGKLVRFLANFIRRLRFFSRFETKALDAVLPGVRFCSVEAGKRMFEEGDQSDHIYVVYSGRLELWKKLQVAKESRRGGDEEKREDLSSVMTLSNMSGKLKLKGKLAKKKGHHDDGDGSLLAKRPGTTNAVDEDFVQMKGYKMLDIEHGDAFGAYRKVDELRGYSAFTVDQCDLLVIDRKYIAKYWLSDEKAQAALRAECCRHALRKDRGIRDNNDTKLIQGVLGTESFMSQLPMEKQVAVSHVLQLRDVEPGELICQQGDVGDCMYIIFWGDAEVYINSSNTSMLSTTETSTGSGDLIDRRYGTHVATVERGSALGEKSIYTGRKRDASILCRNKTEVMRLDKADFDRILKSMSHQIAFRPQEHCRKILALHKKRLSGQSDSRVQQLLRQEIHALLKHTETFSKLETDLRTQIYDMFTPHEFPKDKLILNTGDRVDNVFLMVMGGVSQVNTSNEGAHRRVHTSDQTPLFGNMAIIFDAPQPLTVKTTKPSFFLSLTREDYCAVWKDVLDKPVHDMCLFLRSSAYFSTFHTSELAMMVVLAGRTHHSRGSALVSNHEDKHVRIILGGELELYLGDAPTDSFPRMQSIEAKRLKRMRRIAIVGRGHVFAAAPSVHHEGKNVPLILYSITECVTMDVPKSLVTHQVLHEVTASIKDMIDWTLTSIKQYDGQIPRPTTLRGTRSSFGPKGDVRGELRPVEFVSSTPMGSVSGGSGGVAARRKLRQANPYAAKSSDSKSPEKRPSTDLSQRSAKSGEGNSRSNQRSSSGTTSSVGENHILYPNLSKVSKSRVISSVNHSREGVLSYLDRFEILVPRVTHQGHGQLLSGTRRDRRIVSTFPIAPSVTHEAIDTL